MKWNHATQVTAECPAGWLAEPQFLKKNQKTLPAVIMHTNHPDYLKVVCQWPYMLDDDFEMGFLNSPGAEAINQNELFYELIYHFRQPGELDDYRFHEILDTLLVPQ
ncbi:hypothetical protein GYB59_16715 [bacterium]|nr:hypothetical protein [bacterium]